MYIFKIFIGILLMMLAVALFACAVYGTLEHDHTTMMLAAGAIILMYACSIFYDQGEDYD